MLRGLHDRLCHTVFLLFHEYLDGVRFFTRDSVAIARICHGNSVSPSVRLSVRLSVTRVDQSKTVEARITQFLPYSSPIPLVLRG